MEDISTDKTLHQSYKKNLQESNNNHPFGQTEEKQKSNLQKELEKNIKKQKRSFRLCCYLKKCLQDSGSGKKGHYDKSETNT